MNLGNPSPSNYTSLIDLFNQLHWQSGQVHFWLIHTAARSMLYTTEGTVNILYFNETNCSTPMMQIKKHLKTLIQMQSQSKNLRQMSAWLERECIWSRCSTPLHGHPSICFPEPSGGATAPVPTGSAAPGPWRVWLAPPAGGLGHSLSLHKERDWLQQHTVLTGML